jgi:hypothetical protein
MLATTLTHQLDGLTARVAPLNSSPHGLSATGDAQHPIVCRHDWPILEADQLGLESDLLPLLLGRVHRVHPDQGQLTLESDLGPWVGNGRVADYRDTNWPIDLWVEEHDGHRPSLVIVPC